MTGSEKFSVKTFRYVGHGFAKRNVNAVALKTEGSEKNEFCSTYIV